MKNIRHEIALWAKAITFIGIWVLLAIIGGGQPILSWQAVTKIPDVVLIYGVLYFVFTTWIWRWKAFQGWLVPFPDLQGTWVGELRSTWVNPSTAEQVPAIPIKIVIHQS